ncbi:hypothetical protein SERLADRAFT_344916, partial [Serpula lacrymans var. lacrymans S7.9]
CFVLSDWEGSAANSCVCNNAWSNGFVIPPGLYYLADVDFPSCDSLLVPVTIKN